MPAMPEHPSIAEDWRVAHLKVTRDALVGFIKTVKGNGKRESMYAAMAIFDLDSAVKWAIKAMGEKQ